MFQANQEAEPRINLIKYKVNKINADKACPATQSLAGLFSIASDFVGHLSSEGKY